MEHRLRVKRDKLLGALACAWFGNRALPSTCGKIRDMPHLPRIIRNPQFAVVLLLVCVLLQASTLALNSEKQPQRPRITGIEHVSIYVSDTNRSHRFYSDVLGLANCPRTKGPDSCLLVHPADQRIVLKPVPTQRGNDSLKNWLAEVAFATDNVTEMRRYLLSQGLAASRIRSDPDGAPSFVVRDPEGNSIAFVQRSLSKIAAAQASKQIGSHLIHAGFVVKDLKAENHFYVDLLGFHLYWYGGFKDDTIDWYELQVPNGSDWIEYMLNIPPNADHAELGVQNHFSLGVKNVHAAASQLRSHGLQKFDGPEVGRDGKDSLDAYDPDGTRVEIMEFTPVEKPCCHPYTAAHPTAGD
jgi:catechol 2,3-dioxygenase-like lactoylglutathione lyase family enzyme